MVLLFLSLVVLVKPHLLRMTIFFHRPFSRRLDRCDRVIQNESGDSNGGSNYVRYTKFRNVKRNLHCDVLHITTVRVARLVLDCNGVFTIKAYSACFY